MIDYFFETFEKSFAWLSLFFLGGVFLPVWFVYEHYFKPESIELKEPVSPVIKYMDKNYCDFMDQVNGYEINQKEYNRNIQPEFYDYDEYNKAIKEDNNELEKVWKQRILFENTPQGNVCMFYDAYRKAFAYYSDTKMNYPLLNAVAMKYIKVYYCFDFFVDSQVLPENLVSPFTKMEQEQEKKEKLKKEEKRKELGIDFKGAPFLKPKKKEPDPPRKNESNEKGDEKEKKADEIIYKNVFKYCGTFRYCEVLNKPKIETKPNILIDMGEAPKSYKDFKTKMA